MENIKYYFNDEVTTVSSTGVVKYGHILSTEILQSDTKFSNSTKISNINVYWHPNGPKELISTDKVKLNNRSLMPGHAVYKSVDATPNQFGSCRKINTLATIKILNTNKVIENVDIQSLINIMQFSLNSFVLHDNSSIGKVNDIKYKITFASQDGSTFTMDNPTIDYFNNKFQCDSILDYDKLFYRGQKLKMFIYYFIYAKFLTKSNILKYLQYKKNIDTEKLSLKWVEVYVLDVAISSIEVQWFNDMLGEDTDEDEPIKEVFTVDGFKKLQAFSPIESHSDMLDKKYLYKIKSNDILIPIKQWHEKCMEHFNTDSSSLSNKIKGNEHYNQFQSKKKSTYVIKSIRLHKYRVHISPIKKLFKSFKMPNICTKLNSDVIIEVVNTKSVIDILWQDGHYEFGVRSTDLHLVHRLDDHEFLPCKFVINKSFETMSDEEHCVYGVVRSVNHAERIARVQWFEVFSKNQKVPYILEMNDISVYDLRLHCTFNYKYGSCAIHISNKKNSNKPIVTVGNFICINKSGKAIMKSIYGKMKKYWPQNLIVLGSPNDDLSFEYDDYEEESLNSTFGSTISEESMIRTSDEEVTESLGQDILNKLIKSLEYIFSGQNVFLEAIKDNWDIHMVEKLKTFIHLIKLGFNNATIIIYPNTTNIDATHENLNIIITNLIDKMLKRIDNNNKNDEEDLLIETLIVNIVNELKDLVSIYTDNIKIMVNKLTRDQNRKDELKKNIKTIIESAPVPTIIDQNPTENHCMSSNLNTLSKSEDIGDIDFIEMLPDDSHKYMNDFMDNISSKIIQKDIKLLKENLPGGIWVKIFENHSDLFSVMIRGPEKTPYAGGLFLFDMKLLYNYPLRPPHCYYYNFCEGQLNPNLFENGKICLSLLGTWLGNNTEQWIPNRSNVLQVLVSIQGLILVDEPYFNEDGLSTCLDKKVAEKNSRSYNELVLIKVVQSMANIMNLLNDTDFSILKYFKKEIIEHVKVHGPKLIDTVKNWVAISETKLTDDEKQIPGFPILPLSKGFCQSIEKPLRNYKEALISMNIMD